MTSRQMKVRAQGRLHLVVSVFVALVLSLVSTPSRVPAATLTPTAALGSVSAVGVAGTTVYVDTSTGLYRSASPTYALWAQQSAVTTTVALSPNPHNPQDLVYTIASGTPASGTYRSTDGGRTAARVSSCPLTTLARSASTPSLLYGGSRIADNCVAEENGLGDELARSTDDGVHWKVAYTSGNTYDDSGNIGPIAIDPATPTHVYFADTTARDFGYLMGTFDGGHTWHDLQARPTQANAETGVTPTGIAIDARESSQVWSVWADDGFYGSRDGGHTWSLITTLPGMPAMHVHDDNGGAMTVLANADNLSTLAADPATGRAYLPAGSVTYTIDRFGHINEFTQQIVDQLAITQNGYALSWTDSGNLSIYPLIASGSWTVSSLFSKYRVAYAAARQLGQPISPTAMCGSSACQYFDKGVIEEQNHGAYSYGVLVPRLLAAQSTLPLGGQGSSVTYKTLAAKRKDQTPPPAGFLSGTRAVRGGMFVPYSPHLTAAPGYIVPLALWKYMTKKRTAPIGWMASVGLPMTPAIQAHVVKSGERRTILIQAFQKAILTDDPRNPTSWRVERENIGADYARLFPAAVR